MHQKFLNPKVSKERSLKVIKQLTENRSLKDITKAIKTFNKNIKMGIYRNNAGVRSSYSSIISKGAFTQIEFKQVGCNLFKDINLHILQPKFLNTLEY